MEVYNKKRILEENIPLDLGWKSISYTKHAFNRFHERKRGQFYVLPSLLNLELKMIYKVYIDEGDVVKYKIRIYYDSRQWLCMVLTSSFICKTLWWEKIEKHDKKQEINRTTIQTETTY